MTPLFYPSLNLKAYQDSYIEVYVFDSVTLEPIAGAYITLYDEYYYVYLYVTTDSNGFANFTNLLPSIYYINLPCYYICWCLFKCCFWFRSSIWNC